MFILLQIKKQIVCNGHHKALTIQIFGFPTWHQHILLNYDWNEYVGALHYQMRSVNTSNRYNANNNSFFTIRHYLMCRDDSLYITVSVEVYNN